MKRILFVSALIFCGCNDERLVNTRNYILAGVTEDAFIRYTDLDPDNEIVLVNIVANAHPTQLFKGQLKIDLKVKGSGEIVFKSFYGSLCTPLNPCFSPEAGIQIMSSNTSIEFNATPLNYNDKIDDQLEWIPIAHQSNFLSGSSAYLNREPHNEWSGEDKYLAVRVIYPKDTVYGWVGLQIEDYYKLTLRNFAVNNR
jgi:hypothetical protein